MYVQATMYPDEFRTTSLRIKKKNRSGAALTYAGNIDHTSKKPAADPDASASLPANPKRVCKKKTREPCANIFSSSSSSSLTSPVASPAPSKRLSPRPFRIDLPQVVERVLPAASESLSPRRDQDGEPWEPCIAIVDDNPINIRILAKLVQKHLGYVVPAVNFFANGLELLHALACRTFDLILLDIVMPVLDGCTTCMCIRNMSTPADLPYYGLEAAEKVAKVLHSEEMDYTNCRPSSSSSEDSGDSDSATPGSTRRTQARQISILPQNVNVPIIAVTSNALPHEVELYRSIGVNEVIEKPVRSGTDLKRAILSLLKQER
ncbi:hypothetical protein BC832DRAFT_141305 [Gaertneriomyces semiglobifer]|nr:hypothetical protein BC832DRAFT_141305 [Gaertneriomyces semiglobifer]